MQTNLDYLRTCRDDVKILVMSWTNDPSNKKITSALTQACSNLLEAGKKWKYLCEGYKSGSGTALDPFTTDPTEWEADDAIWLGSSLQKMISINVNQIKI